jgi:hypothetical protein
MAYYARNPFGAKRDNIHAALICSTMANVHGNKSTPSDFMLKPADEIQQQKNASLMQFMMKISEGKK